VHRKIRGIEEDLGGGVRTGDGKGRVEPSIEGDEVVCVGGGHIDFIRSSAEDQRRISPQFSIYIIRSKRVEESVLARVGESPPRRGGDDRGHVLKE
jgi:hypothetical protein